MGMCKECGEMTAAYNNLCNKCLNPPRKKDIKCKECGCNTSGTNVCDECLCTMCGLRPATCDDVDAGMCDECTKHNYPALFGMCALCGDKMSTHGFYCDEKKRTSMQNLPQTKYEVIEDQFISMSDVHHGPSSQGETQEFMEHWWRLGYRFFSTIPVDEKFLIYAANKKCLLKWLEKIGKLKKVKVFQSFTIEIPVNSQEEYWEVWHRMNAHYTNFGIYREHMVEGAVEKTDLTHINFKDTNSHKLWKYVNQYRRKNGL
jgi:hypothetical protein